MEKLILFEPGYDRRSTDPNKNYGIHGMQIRFVLKGELGAVQFLVFTDWYPERTQKEYMVRFPTKDSVQPYGADIGYHSQKPTYPGQDKLSDACEFLGGVPCYYDGSGLAAESLVPEFLERGTDAVWERLESYYQSVFDELR